MPQPKPVLYLGPDQMQPVANTAEAGMDLYALGSDITNLVLVRSNGFALPWYQDANVYTVQDAVAGTVYDTTLTAPYRGSLSTHASRASLAQALRKTRIAPTYLGGSGAHPLIGSVTLPVDTVLYRILSAPTDLRFNGEELSANTYLTTELDRLHANTGFACIGRYALPLPIPASYVVQYHLLANTQVLVGTVAPLFGQSGGGVEVCLVNPTPMQQIGRMVLHDY